MKHIMDGSRKQDVICLGDQITYGMRKEWGSSTWRPLKLSLMGTRQHWSYDPQKRLPLIIWLCGGGFTHVDVNVWMPELVYFAERGYVIASIEYSTTPNTVYPQQLDDIAEAIRFLAAHADEFHIDLSRCAIMGESAGAYLAGLTALTWGQVRTCNETAAETCAISIKAAVLLYPPVALGELPGTPVINAIMKGAPDLTDLITGSAPPVFIAHGMSDNLIPYTQSEHLYEALEQKGIESELYLIRDCDHADSPVFQLPVKELIAGFLAAHTL